MLSIRLRTGEEQVRASRLRFLLYCHDTFGLGHVRRALSLAAHFTAALPDAEVLIVTGSPLAHSYTLPPRTDYVKLPAVTKQASGAYRARSLELGFAAIRDLRATILRETVRAYRPDVFLVDHAPQGLKGEALPTLAMLRDSQPDCLRVLGLRDIIDAGHVVRQTWRDEGVYQTLERDYHLILVYGSQKLYDLCDEYALPASVKHRVRYCGYLDRVTEVCSPDETTAVPGTAGPRHDGPAPAEKLVVLTAGGGGDGFPLMRNYLLGLRQLPSIPFASVLLTGPLMAEAEQGELRELAAALPPGRIRLETFLSDPLPLLGAADLVVAMAGYNTTCELLALRQRVLLVPRATPRQEQLIRASLLARHGLVRMLHPDRLTPETVIDSVQQSLLQPRPQARQLAGAGISFHGQALAREAILAELDRRAARRWVAGRVMAHAIG